MKPVVHNQNEVIKKALLKGLPSKEEKTINLRQLLIQGTIYIKQIHGGAKLKNIQRRPYSKLRESSCTIH